MGGMLSAGMVGSGDGMGKAGRPIGGIVGSDGIGSVIGGIVIAGIVGSGEGIGIAGSAIFGMVGSDGIGMVMGGSEKAGNWQALTSRP